MVRCYLMALFYFYRKKFRWVWPQKFTKDSDIFRFYERLQRYLKIAYQQGLHISNENRTHDLIGYEFTLYQLGPLGLHDIIYLCCNVARKVKKWDLLKYF